MSALSEVSSVKVHGGLVSGSEYGVRLHTAAVHMSSLTPVALRWKLIFAW